MNKILKGVLFDWKLLRLYTIGKAEEKERLNSIIIISSQSVGPVKIAEGAISIEKLFLILYSCHSRCLLNGDVVRTYKEVIRDKICRIYNGWH